MYTCTNNVNTIAGAYRAEGFFPTTTTLNNNNNSLYPPTN